MTNKKISALTSATTPLAGTEVLPIVQSSATVKVAVNDMLSVTSWTSPAVDSNGNMFLRATDAFATGVGTQIGLGGKYNTTSYYPFAAISGRKENATGNNVAGYLSLLTTTSGGTLTERWRVDSAGNFVQKGAGYGINFTANTPAAGMTSQLLNWYEEGTYTPTINSGFTSTGTVTVSGTYTRVGRAVTIRVVINSTGTVYIAAGGIGIVDGALPYAQASGGRVSGTFNSTYSVLQGGLVQFAGTTAYLIPGVTAAMNSGNTQITFVCTYQV